MSVIDFLLDLFGSEEQQDEFANNPSAFLDANAPDGLTAEAILAAMPGVCAELPAEQADSLRTAYGLDGPSGNGGGGGGGGIDPGSNPLPPPPTPDPGGDPLENLIEQINYYTTVTNVTNQTFEDNDVTNIDDRDTQVDQSVNQNITAFGDVTQDFDNDVVSGDGNALGGDNSQVNSGAGAVQAGGDIEDSNVVTGAVTDSVLADDIEDSVVGDGNEAIIDSSVGAASFGDGDATNVDAQNANVGDGTQIVGGNGDVNANVGDGDFTQIDDSALSESVVGGGTVQSNDVNITADDGAAVGFGAGSSADGSNVDVDDVSGNVQVAGDDSTQVVDQSTDNSINDSYNATDSFNATDNSVSDSYNIDDSFDTEVDASDNSVAVDASDNSIDVSDDDGIDIA